MVKDWGGVNGRFQSQCGPKKNLSKEERKGFQILRRTCSISLLQGYAIDSLLPDSIYLFPHVLILLFYC